MQRSIIWQLATVIFFVFFSGVALSAGAENAYPVSGLKPDQRPEGAPVIRFMSKDAAWHLNALAGVSRPYPQSLWFLDNQGGWFNPFLRPGMKPPYDIRDHHK